LRRSGPGSFSADFERVLQGFEPGGVLFPLVMAEVTVRGASGNDEVIED
jgi:hypothetical protein